MSTDLKKEKAKKVVDTPVIYCGPNIPKAMLNQFTVFQNGLPKHLDKHLKACPIIQQLIVPVEKLNDTLEAIKTTGTPENVWFQQVLEYNKGVGN
ncbi:MULTISPECIES: hypothetical protein [Anoxybacillus]|jgi:hypothetical protein|uniref:hypothetical protein n=1 Tax=Anoxybacillus TaxID=150247 RepID=UPI0013CFECF2|nr:MULTISPECIES: hypothetical protein [Anoxybacillus]MED0688174.1 hypothetical protein [Anoxybacillus ayderensis]